MGGMRREEGRTGETSRPTLWPSQKSEANFESNGKIDYRGRDKYIAGIYTPIYTPSTFPLITSDVFWYRYSVG